jgi:hypothetical protein
MNEEKVSGDDDVAKVSFTEATTAATTIPAMAPGESPDPEAGEDEEDGSGAPIQVGEVALVILRT